MKYQVINNSGFTVIEVMTAVVLLAIGFLALASLNILGIRGNTEGEERTKAAMVLETKLNEFRAMYYVHKTEGSGSATGATEFDDALTETGGLTTKVYVNEIGLTKDEFEIMYGGGTANDNDFRFGLQWNIVDQGDITQAGSYKELAIQVSWLERSGSGSAQVEVNQVLLLPKYL